MEAWWALREEITKCGKRNLLYVRIRTLYFGIAPPTPKARSTLFEFFGHADKVGEVLGVHFFHDLTTVKFDRDLART